MRFRSLGATGANGLPFYWIAAATSVAMSFIVHDRKVSSECRRPYKPTRRLSLERSRHFVWAPPTPTSCCRLVVQKSVLVPTPRSRHGKIRIASGDGRGETRGAPPKSRSADFAYRRSHRDACQPTQENKCHSTRDLLNHPHRVARAGRPRCRRLRRHCGRHRREEESEGYAPEWKPSHTVISSSHAPSACC